MGLPTATVQMLGPDGITHVATGLGTGPVDAAYKAIDSLIRVPVRPAQILANPPAPGDGLDAPKAVQALWHFAPLPHAVQASHLSYLRHKYPSVRESGLAHAQFW